MQSLVHVCFDQTNTMTSVRFGLFSVQIVEFSMVDWDPRDQVEWNA